MTSCFYFSWFRVRYLGDLGALCIGRTIKHIDGTNLYTPSNVLPLFYWWVETADFYYKPIHFIPISIFYIFQLITEKASCKYLEKFDGTLLTLLSGLTECKANENMQLQVGDGGDTKQTLNMESVKKSKGIFLKFR